MLSCDQKTYNKCGCGAKISSANFARHQKTCTQVPEEIILDPQIIDFLNSIGIMMDNVRDISVHPITIVVKSIDEKDGSTKLDFKLIQIADLTLAVQIQNK